MVCCSANPVMRAGTDAVASVHRFQSPNVAQIPPPKAKHRLRTAATPLPCERREPSAMLPLTGEFARCRKPFMRASLSHQSAQNRKQRTEKISAQPSRFELSRSESGDPVCRPIRLSLSSYRLPAFAYCPGLRCRPLRANSRSYALRRSGQRGTLISGRFRGRKLIGSGQLSKCFFAGVHCLSFMPVNVTFLQRGRAAHR